MIIAWIALGAVALVCLGMACLVLYAGVAEKGRWT